MVIVTTKEADREIMTASLSAGGRFVNGMSRKWISGCDGRTSKMEGICNLCNIRIMLDFVQFRSPMKVKMKVSKVSSPRLTGKPVPKTTGRSEVGTHG